MPQQKPIRSHTASPVGVSVLKDGTVIFKMSDYYKRHGRVSQRLVVETGENGEMVSETLHRALNDEVSESPDSVVFNHFDPERRPFFVKFKRDERNRDGQHAMFFFLGEFIGEVRKDPKPDGDEELGPIVGKETESLINQMYDSRTAQIITVPVHLEAVIASIHALALKNVEVYYRYSKLLSQFPAPEPPGEEELNLVRAYEKWF